MTNVAGLPRSSPAALDWVLKTRGFVLDDGSPLAQMAEEVWDTWWSRWRAPDAPTATEHIKAALAAPRPVFHGLGNYKSCNAMAWLRTRDHIVTVDTPFPLHHTVEGMGDYLSGWTADKARNELAGASWKLMERPDGWASTVVTNGRHRSLLALAAGVPVVPVRLSETTGTAGGPYTLTDPSDSGPQPRIGQRLRNRVTMTSGRWSATTVTTLARLAREGLCAPVHQDQITQARSSMYGDVEVPWVDIEFPWIVAETWEGVQRRRADLQGWSRRRFPATHGSKGPLQ